MMDIARAAGIIEQRRTLLPFLAFLDNRRDLATYNVSLTRSSETAIACGLGRSNSTWPSASSGVTVPLSRAVEDGGRGQQNGSKLREAVSQGCALWAGDTPAEPDPQPGFGNMLLSPVPSACNMFVKSSFGGFFYGSSVTVLYEMKCLSHLCARVFSHSMHFSLLPSFSMW